MRPGKSASQILQSRVHILLHAGHMANSVRLQQSQLGEEKLGFSGASLVNGLGQQIVDGLGIGQTGGVGVTVMVLVSR